LLSPKTHTKVWFGTVPTVCDILDGILLIVTLHLGATISPILPDSLIGNPLGINKALGGRGITGICGVKPCGHLGL